MAKLMQTCVHAGQGRELREMLVSGISITVCAECKAEIESRITTETRDETPIEHYARSGKMLEQGCTYNLGTEKKKKLCKKMCDPGQATCPRHRLIVEAEQKAANEREYEKRVMKKVHQAFGVRTGHQSRSSVIETK